MPTPEEAEDRVVSTWKRVFPQLAHYWRENAASVAMNALPENVRALWDGKMPAEANLRDSGCVALRGDEAWVSTIGEHAGVFVRIDGVVRGTGEPTITTDAHADESKTLNNELAKRTSLEKEGFTIYFLEEEEVVEDDA